VSSPSPNIVLGYAEAAEVVLSHARALEETPRPVESVSLLDSLNRVLAGPVVADRDQPPFNRSTRDGFACRAAGLDGTQPLRILGLLRSGDTWAGPHPKAGEAIEIMTGAPVPEGLDCVVMVEHTTAGNGFVRTAEGRKWTPGENIVPRGAEARAGASLLAAGTRLLPPHLAIAAACGRETLPVYARPRVAILATGDELVPLGQTPLPCQIRNSNSYSLAAQVARAGGEAVILPAAPDRQAAIEDSIRTALACDLILLSGGVSMGKYDFVEQALASQGAEFFFTGVRIQPGRPVVFGRLPADGSFRYFFGLPGNPVSTMVTFALFARTILGALCGQNADSLGPDFGEAHLEAAVEPRPGLTRFLPARKTSSFAGTTVRLQGWQGSGDIAAAAESNCFLVLPDGSRRLEAGERVSILSL
jgi:molybdopterin molybdotransferase